MLKTRHEKKALLEASIVMAILVALMFIVGLKYLDPPPPGNIAVNFGFSEKGSGKIQPASPKPVKKQTVPRPQKTQKEQILTQNTQEAPVVKSTKKPRPKVKTSKPVQSTPKPSKETTEVLENIFNAPEGASDSSSEGDDAGAKGDKGNPSGDKNSGNYYGTGGSGTGDPNYMLGNRRAIRKPPPSYRCNEEGIVVVRITVDRAGRVIGAVKARGTTASECLTKAAIEAAKKTLWEPAPGDGPKQQIGKIIYRFKLTE